MSAPRVIEGTRNWILHDPSSTSPHGRLYIPRDGRWKFNGDYANPTFTPSVNESWNFGEEEKTERNHYILTNGEIHFCEDCTHGLAGQIVPVPPLTEAELEMYWPGGQKVVAEDR